MWVLLVSQVIHSQQFIADTSIDANLEGSLVSADTMSLRDAFMQAQLKVHWRTFMMNTVNEGSLKDDYAIATGAGIGITTKQFHGFQLGLSGFFIYNLNSSNLEFPDTFTNASNRYEVGLFDVQSPARKNNLYRLEELYVKYQDSKSSVVVGKMNINTPFLNPQDGRMRPTLEEGVWIRIDESQRVKFSGGWIWGVAPRSTMQWFKLDESIGVYPSGVNAEGAKSDYYGNINSKGIFIANAAVLLGRNSQLHLWNGFLENVMNTSLIELTSQTDVSRPVKLYAGLMFLHQNALHESGNPSSKKTYIQQSAISNVISSQMGIKYNRLNTSLNHTHITGDGQYLMPREWGREPFYTFMPRERSEGFGGLSALVLKTEYLSKDERFTTGFGYGIFQLPDVKNYRLNKYGMPSYRQMNFDVAYKFSGKLNGLAIRFIAAYKLGTGETYNNMKYVYNKVNMINNNLIIDFTIK